ncbi:hypothetical protein WJX72_004471 [[Myrmecia] bisecta]|uniref:DUS-like FMN-binding domain-containing protein n=1 Tax=[Myrmecia] bisecta TaxID=41462 RepID=A0AAW1R5X9_9CHLO
MAPTSTSGTLPPQLLSVAPMMDWTDVHYRQLARLLSKNTWLYTEMVVDKTLIHNPDHDRFLWFPPEQHPVVCQLGGSDPASLAAAVKIVERYGYDEINLNCGCPSSRVAGAGCFGAALMLRPELVAACCQAMAEATSIPITVKCRLGVDDVDSYEELCHFIHTVAEGSPVRHFHMHSRKCLLKGLDPHQNRTIPPLKREWVFALKRDFPHLHFYLNGGVLGHVEAAEAIAHRTEGGGSIHGAMIGRAAYYQPWDCLSDVDLRLYGAETNAAISRRQVLEEYGRYGDSMVLEEYGRYGDSMVGRFMDNGKIRAPNVRTIVKPLLNMFHGEPGCKKWKQALDKALKSATSVSSVLQETLVHIPDRVLDAPPKVATAPVLAFEHWQSL